MPMRLEDAISVTACTERSSACGWRMRGWAMRLEDAISIVVCIVRMCWNQPLRT